MSTPPPSDPSRRERKRDARRQQILEAAGRLFKSKGYEATSVDDIAEEADIAKGTIYYHFDTKEEIVLALTINSVEDARSRILDSLAQGQTVIEALQTFFVEASRWTEENAELAKVIFAHGPPFMRRRHGFGRGHHEHEAHEPAHSEEGHPTPPPHMRKRRFLRPEIVPVDLIKTGQRRGEISSDFDPQWVADLFSFLFVHAQRHWVMRGGHESLQDEVLSNLDAVLYGIASNPMPK
jgi:AcrR family transcriptional regulator